MNAPFVIASVTVLGSLMGLLVAASLAGDAGARDVQTRMHPLLYTTPVGKAAYLGGRFLAAFVLNLLILAAVPVGLVLAALVPRAEAELIGPFRPAAYLGAYVFLALPNAFVATALLFSLSALGRRAIASYLGSVLLFFATIFSWQFVAGKLGWWSLAKLLDPLGFTVLSELSRAWTPAEKNTLLVGTAGSLLANRVLWLGIALGVLALHPPALPLRPPIARLLVEPRCRDGRRPAPSLVPPPASDRAGRHDRRTAGPADVRARNPRAADVRDRRAIVPRGGDGLGRARPRRSCRLLLVLSGPEVMEHMGVPLLPTTAQITAYLADPQDIFWLLIPLLIVFFAGELVWREREAGLSEIADAAPVPEWVSFVGKLLGLGLVLVLLQALDGRGRCSFRRAWAIPSSRPGCTRGSFSGSSSPDYLLFVLLALAVHVVVDQKYVGHMVVLIAYGFTAFAAALGIEHNLLVYGSDPGWAYSDMRGFAPFLAPLVWFKLYWAAWALLLAVAAKLFWVRGKETGLGSRLQLARPPLHACDGRRRGCGGGAHPHVGRFHLLQHERAERVPHGLRHDGAARRIRAALRAIQRRRRSLG